MKIKTSELTAAALDWAVAKADGVDCRVWKGMVVDECSNPLMYHDDWGLAGPIIEREGIEVRKGNPLYFPKGNENGDFYEPLWTAGKMHGQTPLVAAMRCFVCSKLGDEVEVPEELQ